MLNAVTECLPKNEHSSSTVSMYASDEVGVGVERERARERERQRDRHRGSGTSTVPPRFPCVLEMRLRSVLAVAVAVVGTAATLAVYRPF
jgi:hypothetical protein